MRGYYLALFVILNSCLVPPAPHRHVYKAIGDSTEIIEVFCTPRVKTFLYADIPDLEINICSKTIPNTDCMPMIYDERFGSMMYQGTFKIRDGLFHKALKNDTMVLQQNSSKTTVTFVPNE